MSIFAYKYTEDTGSKSQVLTPGEAQFTVKAVYEKNKDGSPKETMGGVPKISLGFNVVDCNQKSSYVYDDFSVNMGWKIRDLTKAIGKPNMYDERGEIDTDDLMGATGKCRINTKVSASGKESTIIEGYLESDGEKINKETGEVVVPDDACPF